MSVTPVTFHIPIGIGVHIPTADMVKQSITAFCRSAAEVNVRKVIGGGNGGLGDGGGLGGDGGGGGCDGGTTNEVHIEPLPKYAVLILGFFAIQIAEQSCLLNAVNCKKPSKPVASDTFHGERSWLNAVALRNVHQ